MKRLIIYILSSLILSGLTIRSYAQQGFLVDKDDRIAKYEKDIVLHLIKEKQVMDIKTPFNMDDYENQITVRKYLEIYSGSDKKVLLVRFSTSADHGDRFWGILTENEKYFFYDADDNNEPDLLIFRKKYDPETVATILFYCYQHPPPIISVSPLAIAVYNQNLTIIKDALYKNDLTISDVNSAILFLENKTGIKRGLNKNNSGVYHLTRDDYTRWLTWLHKNYSKLH